MSNAGKPTNGRPENGIFGLACCGITNLSLNRSEDQRRLTFLSFRPPLMIMIRLIFSSLPVLSRFPLDRYACLVYDP